MIDRCLLVLLLLFVGFGCNLFSGGESSDEIVFGKTEVGTPVGDKASKGIGPAGGSLTSPDGKLTLTVPNGAVKENTSFSIQPITNTSASGIGTGYRLEPHDVKFITPLELSVRFDDNDLEGTVAEALALAYQDSEGAWHAPTASRLDMNAKTLTVSTTHFSDWLFLRQLAITPVKAKVLVGETVFIKIDACTNRNWYERINIFVRDRCRGQSTEGATWELKGAGSLTRADRSSGAVYTAPPVKPSDNKVRVILDIEIKIRDRDTGEVRIYPRTFESRITIIDRGYKATGSAGPVVFDGVICDLAAPFTVNGRHPMLNYPLKFVPSSPVNGKWSYSASVSLLKTSGNGTYTVSDSSPDHPPRIEIVGMSTASIPVKTLTGGGPAFIYLEPNAGNECIQNE
jgi:hypothetical protein